MNSKQTFQEIESMRQLLKEAGLRCTSARMTVVHELKQGAAPVSHAELAAKLVPFGFDKATLFRNLGDLVEAGLARRIELGDHVWRFEWCHQGTGVGEHPHFLCTDCGAVSCLTGVSLKFSSRTKKKEFGEVTEILLKGHCSKCLATLS